MSSEGHGHVSNVEGAIGEDVHIVKSCYILHRWRERGREGGRREEGGREKGGREGGRGGREGGGARGGEEGRRGRIEGERERYHIQVSAYDLRQLPVHSRATSDHLQMLRPQHTPIEESVHHTHTALEPLV